MKIHLNKDFNTEYKMDFWKGFSRTEVGYILQEFILGGIVAATAFFVFKVSLVFCIYIAVPFAALVVFAHMYKYQGYLAFIEAVKEMRYSEKCRVLVYETDEKPDRHFSMYKERKEGYKNGILHKSGKKIC